MAGAGTEVEGVPGPVGEAVAAADEVDAEPEAEAEAEAERGERATLGPAAAGKRGEAGPLEVERVWRRGIAEGDDQGMLCVCRQLRGEFYLTDRHKNIFPAVGPVRTLCWCGCGYSRIYFVSVVQWQ